MTHTQTQVQRVHAQRWIFLIGGYAAIIGSLLGMVGNLAHPQTPLDDRAGMARVIADSALWVPIHLGIVVGLVLMLGGLLALEQSLTGALPRALGRFGVAAAIVGCTAGTVTVALDGVAGKVLADRWAATLTESDAARSTLASSLELELVVLSQTLDFALVTLLNMFFAGAAFILFGLAVACSDRYPTWLGWIAVGAGVGSVVVGIYQGWVGESTLLSQILTIIGPTVITLWLLVMGVLLVRAAGRLEATAAEVAP